MSGQNLLVYPESYDGLKLAQDSPCPKCPALKGRIGGRQAMMLVYITNTILSLVHNPSLELS